MTHDSISETFSSGAGRSNRARGGWFKHFNTASQGHTLSTLWANNDTEAIALFWLLLELVSRFEDRDSEDGKRGEITISWSVLARETNWKPSKCRRVLARIAPISKIEISEKQEGYVSFLIPNWLEFQENRGQKKSKKSGKTTGRCIEDRGEDERPIDEKNKDGDFNSSDGGTEGAENGSEAKRDTGALCPANPDSSDSESNVVDFGTTPPPPERVRFEIVPEFRLDPILDPVLSRISNATQEAWLKTYELESLRAELQTAVQYYAESGDMEKLGLKLITWLGRSKTIKRKRNDALSSLEAIDFSVDIWGNKVVR